MWKVFIIVYFLIVFVFSLDHKIIAICDGTPMMKIGHITSLKSCTKIAVIVVQSKKENKTSPVIRFPQTPLKISATSKLTGTAQINTVQRFKPALTFTYVYIIVVIIQTTETASDAIMILFVANVLLAILSISSISRFSFIKSFNVIP